MRPERRRAATIKAGTFANVCHAYLASPKFAVLAPNTQVSYRRVLRLAELPETLGAISTVELRPAHVQAFLDGLADRPAQQLNALRVLHTVERWAIVRDLLMWPITMGCEVIGSDGGHEPWTDQQVQLAEKYALPHLARAITLGSNTGQRGSDLVKMRWTDLETYQGRPGINVIQKKTGVKIWIPMTQELMRIFPTWERRPGFILLKASGQPWTREQLSNRWLQERDSKPALAPLKEAGLVIHGLRATAAVRLRRAGATTAQIKDMLGMSEETVSRYCRLSVQRENALAAVVHLDRTHIERGRSDLKNSGV
jgi:integrase